MRTMTVSQKFLFFFFVMKCLYKKNDCKVTYVFAILDAHYSGILEDATTSQRKNQQACQKQNKKKRNNRLKLQGKKSIME